MTTAPKRFHDPLGQGAPKTALYHYASQDGIRGIVGEKELWATNIEFLNDMTEFIHGLEIIDKAIAARKNRNIKDEDEQSFFNWHESSPPTVEPGDVFVISLSEQDDLLSQWRGYTPRNRGFSVGFDPAELEKAAWEIDHMVLVKCVYTEKDKESLIQCLLDEYLAEWKTFISTDEKGNIWENPSIPIKFGTRSKFAAAAMKNSTFSEECEWRLVGVCRDKSRFRFLNGESMLVPYVALNWKDKSTVPNAQPIKSVTLGPCPNQDLSEKSVRKLLDSHGLTNVAIHRSSIPYRTW